MKIATAEQCLYSALLRVLLTDRRTAEVAVLGKATGDRSTLYKYLNPHLLAVATASEQQLSVYLVDSISGSIVWSTTHQVQADAESIALQMTENWIIYTYTDATTDAKAAASIVSVELYQPGPAKGKAATLKCVPTISGLHAFR